MQAKKKTKNIKVRDLKPKKDAKGGVVADGHTTQNHGTQFGIKGHGTQYGIKGSGGHGTT